MPGPLLDLGQYDLIVSLGERRKGITVPEVASRLRMSRMSAWRAIQRLVQAGKLHRINRKRRRVMLFERPGRGADIYKTRPEPHA